MYFLSLIHGIENNLRKNNKEESLEDIQNRYLSFKYKKELMNTLGCNEFEKDYYANYMYCEEYEYYYYHSPNISFNEWINSKCGNISDDDISPDIFHKYISYYIQKTCNDPIITFYDYTKKSCIINSCLEMIHESIYSKNK
jgi:hypothetical protein